MNYNQKDSSETIEIEKSTETRKGVVEQPMDRQPSLFKDAIARSFQRLERVSENPSEITGIPTGFHDLDKMLSGLQPSNLIVVAGRPSMGKTAFAQNIATYASIGVEPRSKVLVFSLDMSEEQFASRILYSEANVDSSKLRKGNIEQEDWDQLAQAIDILSSASIKIMDKPNLSPEYIRKTIQQIKHDDGLDLIIIDYLQLMMLEREPAEGKNEIDEIIYELKCIAKEFDIPVLVLSQLNRALENRGDHHPELRDLKGSGYIEELADVILFLYRDEVYDGDSLDKGFADIIIAKHKNGPTGLVRLAFVGKHLRFFNLPMKANKGEIEKPGNEVMTNKNRNGGIYTLVESLQLQSEIGKWASRNGFSIIEGEPFLNGDIHWKEILIFVIDRTLMGKEQYNLWLRDTKHERKDCATLFIDGIRNAKLPNHKHVLCFDTTDDHLVDLVLNSLEMVAEKRI